MPLATKPPVQPVRRIWKIPRSKAKWYWLLISLVLYAGIYAWYLYALKTQRYPGPLNDPLRLFGIIAFVLVLGVATYPLRRRFMRSRLPGKVQDWLWLHTWFGMISLLIALLHENYANVLHDFYITRTFLTEEDAGMSALYALLLLVITGIVGRLLDVWHAHAIAAEANSNGVGIPQAVEERLLELELTVERLCAGKSAAFKQYCSQALSTNGLLTGSQPLLASNERADFRRVYDVLTLRARLLRSLQRQRRSRQIMQAWRYVHIPLAYVALAIMCFHSIAELVRYP